MNNTRSFTEMLGMYEQLKGRTPVIIPPSGDDLDSPERIEKQLAEGVKRGQLWSAASDDDMLYLLITEVDEDPRMAHVIPLSNDMRAETDDSLVIGNTPLETDMVAWPDLKAIIPVRLLYRPLKELSESAVKSIENDNLRFAKKTDAIRRGHDSGKSDSPFVESRDDITMTLIKWHAMCFDLPELGEGKETSVEEFRTDDSLVDDSKKVQEVLQLSPAERLAIARGKALTPEQQQMLADANVANQVRKEETIDDDYLIMAEQPRWRTAADAYAATNEGDPRMALAHKAQFELAARLSGHGKTAVEEALAKAAEGIIEDSQR